MELAGQPLKLLNKEVMIVRLTAGEVRNPSTPKGNCFFILYFRRWVITKLHARLFKMMVVEEELTISE